MKKKRNIFAIVISCLGILLVADIVLFAFRIFKLWLFLTFLCASLIGIAVCLVLLLKTIKKIKIMQLKQSSSNKTTGNYMLDVYTLLGIPPQYNKDGSLKNIYEILQIKPVYDENGNRVYTVYELLGIKPMIDANGNEIPQVFAIKNRANRIARVSLSTAFLTRKLSPEEEEQKIIRETLEQKLKEAEQTGDNKKAEAIKKAIKAQDKKKDAKKKSAEKAVAYKAAASNPKNAKFESYKPTAKEPVIVKAPKISNIFGNFKSTKPQERTVESAPAPAPASAPVKPAPVKRAPAPESDFEFVIDAEQDMFR